MASEQVEKSQSERISSDYTNGANGAALSRQVTVTLNHEDYERLFFQPTPARGDLAKRLGTYIVTHSDASARCSFVLLTRLLKR